MSKRHYNIEQGGWNPLTDPTLIFYAPMSNGDLTDHISGNSLNMVNPSRVTWENSVGMYKVIKETQANEMYWNVNLRYDAMTNPYGIQAVNTQDYTLYCYCQRLSETYYSYPPFFILGSYVSSTSWNPSLQSNRFDETGSREFLLGRCCVKQGGYYDTYSYYNNELCLIENEAISNTSLQYCSNWVNDNFVRVAVNPKRGSQDPNINIYISNLMIFSRALTDDEIIFLSNNFTDWL